MDYLIIVVNKYYALIATSISIIAPIAISWFFNRWLEKYRIRLLKTLEDHKSIIAKSMEDYRTSLVNDATVYKLISETRIKELESLDKIIFDWSAKCLDIKISISDTVITSDMIDQKLKELMEATDLFIITAGKANLYFGHNEEYSALQWNLYCIAVDIDKKASHLCSQVKKAIGNLQTNSLSDEHYAHTQYEQEIIHCVKDELSDYNVSCDKLDAAKLSFKTFTHNYFRNPSSLQ